MMNLVSWGDANAMRHGQTLPEYYCKACCVAEMDGLSVQQFLDGTSRGGFVPVLEFGVCCNGCNSTIN